MRINLHIERLVLDGLPETGPPGRVQAAIESELARLLAAGSLKSDLLAGGAVSSIAAPAAPAIQLSGDTNGSGLGAALAGAVYSGIGTKSEGGGRTPFRANDAAYE
jgi:hypothetical protein